jgi:hypothetical protein
LDRRNFLRRTAATSAGLFLGGALPTALFGQAASSDATLLTPDYSPRDYEIVDYGFYSMKSVPRILFRGPPLDPKKTGGNFFTCLGAAQTLGVYVQRPFPTILSETLGLPVWNAGIGGANPNFLNRHQEIIDIANKGRFVILQVMSARAETNARFSSTPQIELVLDRRRGDTIRTPVAWDRVIKEEPKALKHYVAQSQQSWINDYRSLLDKITVPVLLFWFSPKSMNLPLDLSKPDGGAGLIDHYPQFVQGSMVSAIRPLAQDFAECNSARNTGHPLVSRFTGKPVVSDYAKLAGRAEPIKETHNTYYPSPEMHEDAAAVLIKSLRENRKWAALLKSPALAVVG